MPNFIRLNDGRHQHRHPLRSLEHGGPHAGGCGPDEPTGRPDHIPNTTPPTRSPERGRAQRRPRHRIQPTTTTATASRIRSFYVPEPGPGRGRVRGLGGDPYASLPGRLRRRRPGAGRLRPRRPPAAGTRSCRRRVAESIGVEARARVRLVVGESRSGYWARAGCRSDSTLRVGPRSCSSHRRGPSEPSPGGRDPQGLAGTPCRTDGCASVRRRSIGVSACLLPARRRKVPERYIGR